MYHWSVVIPWSHLLSSFQTLTDSMDGPTPNPETYSHPEGGVSEAGWSQNKAQKSGALSTHGIYVRNMGGGQCIRVISWSHPISSLQMLKETQQMVLLEDQNTFPHWRRSLRIWLEPKAILTTRCFEHQSVDARFVCVIEVMPYPALNSYQVSKHLQSQLMTPLEY